jgi:hypothetical protein
MALRDIAASDLEDILADEGETVVYTLKGASTEYTLRGIPFADNTLKQPGSDQHGFEAERTVQVHFRKSTVLSTLGRMPDIEDKMIVGGLAYRVTGISPFGASVVVTGLADKIKSRLGKATDRT